MQKRTKMVHLSWKQCLLVTNIATFFVGVVVALKTDNACFFWSDTPDCSQHHLQCDHGTIFLTQAVRGFKPEDHSCILGKSDCVNKTVCCCNDNGQDCLEMYTQAEFSNLARECWNGQSCNHTVQYAQKTSCNWTYTNPSGYSEVQYVCLDDSAIHNFSDSNPINASSLALRYLSSHGSGDYVCRVTAQDCTPRTSSILLTKWPNTKFLYYCSTLSVNWEDWLPCSASVSYRTYTLTTPFYVWLYVENNEDIAQAWAVINATDSSLLRAKCKPWNPTVSFQRCSPPTMAPASPRPTRQETDSTAFPSSHGTGTSGATTAGVLSTDTSSLVSGPGPDVTEAATSQSAANTGNTAAVVGGVVGAMVVLLLVVVALVVICVRRRNPTANPFPKVVAWFKGGNSSRSHGNSGRPALHVTYAQPMSLPVYENPAAAITDEVGVSVDPDSDYNHLGQKPTSSASGDVTYGHLAVGNDVTDYGYDHVTKGKPAVRSGDVINNIYNTAGPPAAGPCDEDAYNVTGAARNRPDIINNIYNTPSPATEASPDVDYYNTAGVPQTGRDVINSD